jgi:hypothetical protein
MCTDSLKFCLKFKQVPLQLVYLLLESTTSCWTFVHLDLSLNLDLDLGLDLDLHLDLHLDMYLELELIW